MLHDKPRLTVLLPAYNAEKYIALAIRSLLLQTYPNLEILVCDDCSTDNTASIVASIQDPRLAFFKNVSNIGKNKTCSWLLEKSSGEYISVHDADDLSMPDRFEKQMNYLIDHPDFALCGCNFISFLDSGKIIDRSHLEADADTIREKIKTQSQFHGPTIVFRKEILPHVGGFYRYFTRAEDIDLTMRIAEKYKVTNLTDYLYLYRHVPSSLTNNLEGYNIERLGHAKLLYYLAEERRINNGVDSLMRHDEAKVHALMKEFVKEYENDPDIALRRGVFRLLGMHMYRNAVQLSWRAFRKTQSMLNLKCVIYALAHAALGSFKVLLMRDTLDLKFLK